MKWDGCVVKCEPGKDGESGELFGLALGGYGMFGVIAEVTLKLQPNAKLRIGTCKVVIRPFLFQGKARQLSTLK